MTEVPPFFDSRWVQRPDHVSECGGAERDGFPAGFRAAGIAAGLKASGRTDLAILISDGQESVSAARFTRSGVQAAPVLVCRERCDLHALRAVVVNSGNANASTGAEGFAGAVAMQEHCATALGLEPQQVAVASTGVIGVTLPIEKVLRGIDAAAEQIAPDTAADLAAAIMTTDAFEKRVCLEVKLPSGNVKLSAQAKGAGMIQPAFATMLCFIQTDAQLSAETADLLLGVCVKRSFDRISVDGQLSTNDSAILIASGASGVVVEPQSPDELAFGEALDALLRQLALLIVRDGEGSKRVGRVVVRGAGDEVERVARSIANSPLVKTALHGGDPNWGRITQAVGAAMPGTAPLAVEQRGRVRGQPPRRWWRV
ncbi:MAG: bifunctional glutamate N-acetyltransferase/amino-acid acetyltransferase ArgJ [Solirubrobacterales bacterium]|nr:bifunctional glutamate N-acetyltransferase/amino-acid acetyltransferase ArgJ [Solirubrobacterales bacterium]